MCKLNELFQELGISKVRLAKYLGVSRQMVYNYLELNDINKWPKEKKLLLFKLLDITDASDIDNIKVNNAIENAFEGVSICENPYVLILSYRKKNAYMLEITNCISRSVEIDTETGLPETTKQDKLNHGYGLVNIRKVAQKYYGDIDINQNENSFTLIVMLMIE